MCKIEVFPALLSGPRDTSSLIFPCKFRVIRENLESFSHEGPGGTCHVCRVNILLMCAKCMVGPARVNGSRMMEFRKALSQKYL